MKLRDLVPTLTFLTFSVSTTLSAEPKLAANPPSKNVASDVDFIKNAAADGMAEVKLGTLAKQRGKTPEVKKFGEDMAVDHGKANEELKALATTKGIVLAEELPQKHEADAASLLKLSGEEFDAAYSAKMIESHEKAIGAFQKASAGAKDADVKAFATKSLPILKHHLEMARTLPRASKESSPK